MGLTQETEENLDEVQEAAFKFLLATLQTFKHVILQAGVGKVMEQVTKIIEVTKEFMDKNLYKCEKNVFEALLSLIRFLI